MGGLEFLLLGLLPLGLLAVFSDPAPAGTDSGAESEAEADIAEPLGDSLLDHAGTLPPAAPGDAAAETDDTDPDATAEEDTAPVLTAGGVATAAMDDPADMPSATWPETDWPTPHAAMTEAAAPTGIEGAEGSDGEGQGDGGAPPPQGTATAAFEAGGVAAGIAGKSGLAGPAAAVPGAPGATGAPEGEEAVRDATDNPPAGNWATAGTHAPSLPWAADGSFPGNHADWPEFAPRGPAAPAGDPPGGPGAGPALHAGWSPELATAQGSDLFAWRDGHEAATIHGGEMDDRLVLARGDIASGGGGANLFEIWNDPASTRPPAVVTDFTPGVDRLDIVVRIDEGAHPDCGAWEWDRRAGAAVFDKPALEILRDTETGLTEIRVDGATAAHLHGAPAVTAADVRILAFWDVHS